MAGLCASNVLTDPLWIINRLKEEEGVKKTAIGSQQGYGDSHKNLLNGLVMAPYSRAFGKANKGVEEGQLELTPVQSPSPKKQQKAEQGLSLAQVATFPFKLIQCIAEYVINFAGFIPLLVYYPYANQRAKPNRLVSGLFFITHLLFWVPLGLVKHLMLCVLSPIDTLWKPLKWQSSKATASLCVEVILSVLLTGLAGSILFATGLITVPTIMLPLLAFAIWAKATILVATFALSTVILNQAYTLVDGIAEGGREVYRYMTGKETKPTASGEQEGVSQAASTANSQLSATPAVKEPSSSVEPQSSAPFAKGGQTCRRATRRGI